MSSRSNVGAIRSMQIDRGSRIRTFRQLNHPDSACQGADPLRVDDANGVRYAQALDRLTSFKLGLKERVWQDLRKTDWQEENAQLQRASKDLTNSIQALLEAAERKKESCRPLAPAWGGHGSMGAGIDLASHNIHRSRGEYNPQDDNNRRADPESSPEPQRSGAPALNELADFSAYARELEKTRVSDMQADRSHIQELRALVAEFVLQVRGASREGYMAELLVQARTAHGKAGAYLADRASVLEQEVESSRRDLAAALILDRIERASSTQVFVLESIGFSNSEGKLEVAREAGATQGGGEDGVVASRQRKATGGLHEAMLRAEISDRLGALEVAHLSRLEALRSDFLRDAAPASSAGSVEAALDANGGWSAERHFRFMKVIKATKLTTGGAAGGVAGGVARLSATMTKRLAADLPEVLPTEIARHESWYRLRGVYLAKTRAEKQRHARELDELVAWGKKALKTLREEERESASRATQLQEHERRRAELDNLLREQGKARDRRRQEDRHRKEQALRLRKNRETEERDRKLAENERKRNAVAEYQATLRELRAREEAASEAAARAAEVERAQRATINRERVGYRREKARQKQEESERREQEAQALEEKRLQVLEKLAASVPYAEACANAEAKLDHITAATAAHFDQFSPFDRARGHCPMFGYNTRRVFKDARFRLGLYLREAGVSGSKYAHAAVISAVGPLIPAPYGQSA